jgi:hypothetical protein
MTPEERFTKIENALNHAAELHAKHAEEIAELRATQKVILLAIEKTVETQQTGSKELRQGMNQLRQAQQITEEKLHILIDTVDRIIRNQSGQA